MGYALETSLSILQCLHPIAGVGWSPSYICYGNKIEELAYYVNQHSGEGKRWGSLLKYDTQLIQKDIITDYFGKEHMMTKKHVDESPDSFKS